MNYHLDVFTPYILHFINSFPIILQKDQGFHHDWKDEEFFWISFNLSVK